MENTTTATILIVDDLPSNIHILAHSLTPHYQVLIANSGQRALEITQSDEPPDLILLDIMMPDMNGYEVCRRLKNDTKTKDIPIIFVTAMDDLQDQTLGLELGALDYISKPIAITTLKAKIKTHLKIKQQRDQLASRNSQIQTLMENSCRELDEVTQRYQEMKLQQMDLLENMSTSMLPKLTGISDSQKEQISALIDEQVARAMNIFNIDQITDQKLLSAIYTLKKNLHDRFTDDAALDTGHLVIESQKGVDDILALFGL